MYVSLEIDYLFAFFLSLIKFLMFGPISSLCMYSKFTWLKKECLPKRKKLPWLLLRVRVFLKIVARVCVFVLF